ncbi:MAG: GNAT family N-acetyltransferase [Chloroflexi bacterium]|nr:GNAT family N-acetyltransferase [Chloroflexota bacterium]
MHLEWDTTCFGFGVARMSPSAVPGEVAGILTALREANYRLVYWSVPTVDRERVAAGLEHGGFLADEKLRYATALSAERQAPSTAYAAVPFEEEQEDHGLVQLAISSAEYSRYRRDPLFPAALCDKLYAVWIERSVSKEIADEVLVVRDGRNLLGLITLGSAGDRGDIGLVAVDRTAQGKGIGRLLVTEAGRYFVASGRRQAQVVTQRLNVPACRLYESCGYSIERSETVFHFWLQPDEDSVQQALSVR